MMSAQGFGDLTLLLAIPVIGAAVLMFLPRRQSAGLFSIAWLASAAAFLWSLKILDRFDGINGEMQLIERVAWMPAFGIQYILGSDGISIFLVLLTTFLMPLALLASWSVPGLDLPPRTFACISGPPEIEDICRNKESSSTPLRLTAADSPSHKVKLLQLE
jgi:NADH:ubiquinone oxidoreductase subunit 4 (subunit M)